MKTVIYSCPFIPAEWIAAHGLKPVRIMPAAGVSLSISHEGYCPYTRAFINEAVSFDGAGAVVMTTSCDQMRRAFEIVEERCDIPVFLMNVPTTWETPSAMKLYMGELKRMSRFLQRLGGNPPTDEGLREVMTAYDRERTDLRAARGRLPARRFTEAMADFHRTGTFEVDAFPEESRRRGIPLALVGGPLIRSHLDLFDLIEEAGGEVVVDATTSGERTLLPPFNKRELREDPFMTLAGACFGWMPDAFRRPNTLLYAWLKKVFAERGVRGIIFKRYTWCDTWNGETVRMKEWADLPFIALDMGDESRIGARVVTRIQSFLEMLQ